MRLLRARRASREKGGASPSSNGALPRRPRSPSSLRPFSDERGCLKRAQSEHRHVELQAEISFSTSLVDATLTAAAAFELGGLPFLFFGGVAKRQVAGPSLVPCIRVAASAPLAALELALLRSSSTARPLVESAEAGSSRGNRAIPFAALTVSGQEQHDTCASLT